MTTIAKPVNKWPLNSPQQKFHSKLKTLFFEAKMIKGFAKGVGRFVDLTDGDTLWFEVTGNSVPEVITRSRNFVKGKAGTFSNLNIKHSPWYSGGKVLNLTPGPQSAICLPIPATHPDFSRFQEVTAQPKGNIGSLAKCSGNERADVIGKVTAMAPCQVPGRDKSEVWIKGEDDKEVLLEMWGPTFHTLLQNVTIGQSTLQVDNARVVMNDKGTVHLSAEAFKDDERASSWAFIDPPHTRAATVRALSSDRGDRISSAWEPTNKATIRLTATQGMKLKTCMGTLKTNSLAWEQDGQATSIDALPETIEVVLQGVWLTEILNARPVYEECKHCHTKIDEITGNCKKAETGHTTEPGEEKVALSAVRLADESGSYHDVLAHTQCLCQLANVQGVAELEQLVLQGGVSTLTFRDRFDVVVGANQKKKAWAPRGNTTKNPAEILCRFEVLRVASALLPEWDSEDRPALTRVMNTKSDQNSGHVLPLRQPTNDLAATPVGVKFNDATVFPRYVTVLGRVKEPPQEQVVGEGANAVVELVHARVYPAEDSDTDEEKAFAVEVMSPQAEASIKRMPEGLPYLIVGAPICDHGVTIMAENIFDIREIPQGPQRFAAARQGWWKVLRDNVEETEKKRSAKSLMEATPSKKQCHGP